MVDAALEGTTKISLERAVGRTKSGSVEFVNGNEARIETNANPFSGGRSHIRIKNRTEDQTWIVVINEQSPFQALPPTEESTHKLITPGGDLTVDHGEFFSGRIATATWVRGVWERPFDRHRPVMARG